MNDLRMNLNDTGFEQLLERGRAVIPTVAPDWTDHNTHDPGIMLLELLAWIADAQIYSLARGRRDERLAYARLLGVHQRGPLPACGLVWPRISEASTQPLWAPGTVVERTTHVVPDRPEAPPFFTPCDIHLISSRLVRVQSRLADGTVHDWTKANRESRATFRPFGHTPAPGDQLLLDFSGGLLPQGQSTDALISIGVEVASADDPRSESERPSRAKMARLRVTLVEAGRKRELDVTADTTDGLLHSGVLLLRIPSTTNPSGDFSLAIQSASGRFLLSPRLERIAPNVLPVEQREVAFKETAPFGTGLPGQEYRLERRGLIFEGTTDSLEEQVCLGAHDADPKARRMSFTATLIDASGPQTYRRVAGFQNCGPEDAVYLLDPVEGVIRFGNGINGKMPPPGAALQITYPVCAGTRGNLPEELEWRVKTIAGVFGTNSQPTACGRDARLLDGLRSVVRAEVRDSHPLVTESDLVGAARSFSDLQVARAREIAPLQLKGHHVRGTRVLVAVGPHDPDEPPATESSEWLAEIRARLSPRLPMGQRLTVIAPRYVDVRVLATLVAAPHVDPEAVRTAAIERLRDALRLVAQGSGNSEWPFGRDVAPLEVKGWLRKVEGVAKVVAVRLFEAGNDTAGNAIKLGLIGLPRLQIGPSDIAVERWPGAVKS